MSKNFVQVLLPLALDEPFTYLDEIGVEEGDVVKVSFGKKEIWGAVVSCRLLVVGLPLEKIKKILEKNSRVKFSREQLKFIEAIASYNLASRGLVLRAFIGILNSDKVKKIPQGLVQIVDAEKFSLKKLSERQEEIVRKIVREGSSHFVALLDGVTGSGKTEIYFALIAKILSQWTPQQVRGPQR